MTAEPHAYAGAVEHYTSAARRDWVKRDWEEPAFQRHLEANLRAARAAGLRTDLDILDLGCGTGVALDLLLANPSLVDGTFRLDRYTGIDLDAALLAVAGERFASDARVGFEVGDLRAVPPTGPHDLVLSTGVPLSHLEPDALAPALERVLRVATSAGRSALVVIDVLGRWSLEWTTRWDQHRWDYRMSFFATDTAASSTPMTTWDGEELRACILQATTSVGCEVLDLTLVDRSLAVGRHTSTGDYTPGLPRLRDLVNGLAAPGSTLDVEDLRIGLDLPSAPEAVQAHHTAFLAAWNAQIDAFAAAERTGPDARAATSQAAPAPAEPRLALAERLRALEERFEIAGLGVGHSLTAFALVRAADGPAAAADADAHRHRRPGDEDGR